MLRGVAIFALVSALALAACGFADRDIAAQAAPSASQVPATAPEPRPTAPVPAPQAEARKPFVVIRFARGTPPFATPLYEALSGALARKPDARFDLVAVTRDPGAAERNLGAVLRAITAMGMPANRLSLASAASEDEATDEVWIYVR